MSGMCSPKVRVVQKSAVTNIAVIILSHKMGKWVRNNLEMLMGPNTHSFATSYAFMIA